MPLLRIDLKDLEQGGLAEAFATGAIAVVVECPEAVGHLWKKLLVGRLGSLPWEISLADLARNHHGRGDITKSLGDVFYFQPGQHGYIGRKLIVQRDDTGQLKSLPESFLVGSRELTIDRSLIDDAFTLAQRIMESLTPQGESCPPHFVAVQRLKYFRHWNDFQRAAELISNSLGRWGRLGFAIDMSRMRVARPLAFKGISDLLGVMMMVPGLQRPLLAFNRLMTRLDCHQQIPEGFRVIEGPHSDNRYFSAFCGCRENLRTEVYSEGEWIELPVNLDALAIIPGRLAQKRFGIKPTLHRVLQAEHVGAPSPAALSNTTLLIGTI